MSVKIFYDVMSQPSRAILLFCRANKIPFTPCPIAMRKLEHQSEEYAAINPFKKIPALQDGDFKLTESVTIAKYLHAKFGCPDHWYPTDLQRQARVNEYLDWQHTNARRHLMKVFIHDVILPRMTGEPHDQSEIDSAVRKMERALGDLQSYFLKDKPYLCGEEISIADLFGVCEVFQVAATGRDTIEEHPAIRDWIERVRQRLDPNVFDEVSKMIYKIREVKKSNL